MPARRKIGNSVRGVIKGDSWTLITLHDGADLFGTLTRTQLTLRLYDSVDGPIVYGDLKGFFDAEFMCRLIEDNGGLSLESCDWERLIDSALVHH